MSSAITCLLFTLHVCTTSIAQLYSYPHFLLIYECSLFYLTRLLLYCMNNYEVDSVEYVLLVLILNTHVFDTSY